MKKIVCLILCCLMLVACGNKIEKEEVPYETEYERTSQNVSMARPAPLFSFEEALDNSELVAHVKIKGLASNYDRESFGDDYSVFVAEVVDTFGSNKKIEETTIYIAQTTSNKMMRYGYPLFKSGDEFLFCMKIMPADSSAEIEDIFTYYILNGNWGVAQIFMLGEETYVINRAHEDFFREFAGEEIVEEIQEQVMEALYDYDPILETYAKPFYEIYKYEVLMEYLEGIYD